MIGITVIAVSLTSETGGNDCEAYNEYLLKPRCAQSHRAESNVNFSAGSNKRRGNDGEVLCWWFSLSGEAMTTTSNLCISCKSLRFCPNNELS